jgi:hypothetical protein
VINNQSTHCLVPLKFRRLSESENMAQIEAHSWLPDVSMPNFSGAIRGVGIGTSRSHCDLDAQRMASAFREPGALKCDDACQTMELKTTTSPGAVSATTCREIQDGVEARSTKPELR